MRVSFNVRHFQLYDFIKYRGKIFWKKKMDNYVVGKLRREIQVMNIFDIFEKKIS